MLNNLWEAYRLHTRIIAYANMISDKELSDSKLANKVALLL